DVFAAPFVISEDGNADGLPTVLLEAMARGIRCVAADVTAVGEAIHSGSAAHAATGWLVPSGDVGALTQALAEALEPGDHRAKTDAARSVVEQQFSSARQAEQLRALSRDEVPASPAAELRPDAATTLSREEVLT